MTSTEFSPIITGDYTFFVKPDMYDITNRDYETYKQQAEFIQWGRKNPVLFAERVFGIELMDYQKYCFMMSWNTDNVVWCMSRNGGKSVLAAIFLMTKTLLVPNFKAYILCGVGSQSIELFTKIEQITKNSIPSFKSLTDVYASELVKNNSNGDGFVRNPASYHYGLYNNSQVFTLNGAYNNNRSKRSNCNFYDEAMNSPDELFDTSEPFCSQNSKFAMGSNYDVSDMKAEPKPFVNQLIYASSAGRTDQYFYKKYRECSLRMDAGDKRYFCADIDCNIILNATKRGVGLPEPLLTQEVIDSAMRKNKEAAMREYMNLFTSEGGVGQIIRRADVIKNSVPRVPALKNEGGKQYILAWDPAQRVDNSAVVVAEIYLDENVGYKMRFVNTAVIMRDVNGRKIPKRNEEQVEVFRKMLVDYNGEQAADYENILKVLVDAGSGGGAKVISQLLCSDFEMDGVEHRGLIDVNHDNADVKAFPNAIRDKIQLIEPTKYKSEMFEAMISLVQEDLVEFPEEYGNKGYINLIYQVDENGNKTQRFNYPSEKEEKILKKNNIRIETKVHHLTEAEEVALSQIDMMKTELCNMYRFPRDGTKDKFELAPDKRNVLHDDRAYAAAMCCFYLYQLRLSSLKPRKRPKTENLVEKLPFRAPKKVRTF